LFVHVVLERWDNLLPDRVVLWESFNSEDLTKLNNVGNFELLQFEVRIEYTVVELTKEAKRVSQRQVLLLAVINSDILVDLWSIVTLLWLWDSLEVLVVLGVLKSILELFEVSAVIQLLGSAWVQVTQVVEVLLTEALSLCVGHVLSSKGVVDDLQGLPVGLGLKDVVHHFLCGSIGVGHDPSVEGDKPDLFKEDLDVRGRIVVNHLRNVLDTNSVSLLLTVSFVLSEESNNGVNKLPKVFSNRKIDQNILEKTNEILAGER
jgi:hypothetical protein